MGVSLRLGKACPGCSAGPFASGAPQPQGVSILVLKLQNCRWSFCLQPCVPVCVCVHVCMHVHMCICHAYVCVFVHTCIVGYVSVCVPMCTPVYLCACVCVYIHICMSCVLCPELDPKAPPDRCFPQEKQRPRGPHHMPSMCTSTAWKLLLSCCQGRCRLLPSSQPCPAPFSPTPPGTRITIQTC